MQIGKRGLAVLGLALMVLPLRLAIAESPAVVVSIKPLHSLVAAVMAGVAEPTLLVKGAASPHSYSLRPSAARALERAKLIFWVGEGMETFLVEPLEALAGQARLVEIAALPEVALLEAREGGAWEVHAHEDHEAHAEADHYAESHEHANEAKDHEHAEHAGHVEHDRNLHLWLDPHNAEVIVKAAVKALGEVDPANAERYQANGEATLAELEMLDDELRRDLSAVKDTPFVVFHDAYHYFEAHYGLAAVGSISVDEGRAPGAKRLREVREKIVQSGARCVFSEPQFAPALVATVVEGTPARTAVLDPLGAELAAGPAAYAQIMRELADSLNECLAPQS